METPPIQRPVPRRPYDLPGDVSPIGDFPGTERWLDLGAESDATTSTSEGPPKRSKSAISLNASTLFGIYSRSYTTDEVNTPFQLSRNPSVLNMGDLRTREEASHPNFEPTPAASQTLIRIVSLFVFGVAYGVIVTHLHHTSPLGWLATFDFDRWSTTYLVFWGFAGVGLGSVLPWLDGQDDDRKAEKEEAKRDWTPAIRSIGAFVGIAFAIRRLPWQSTLQVSLALALVNPFLWFVVDRTRSGFWFSTLVGLAGTVFLLNISPEMIQTPNMSYPDVSSYPAEGQLIAGMFSLETVAVGTWIASVLFCSCVCFGNIGRRFAVKTKQGIQHW